MQAWSLFCQAVRHGSVRQACRAGNLDPSAVSRTIQSLEAALGAPLFDRARRPARLTDFGERAYREMSEVLAAHERAVSRLKGNADSMQGTVTLASPAAFGAFVLPTLLVAFQRLHPGIELRWTELSPEMPGALLAGQDIGVDVLLCYGPLAGTDAAAVSSFGQMRFFACASPLYLRRHGNPKTPPECRTHCGILLHGEPRSSTVDMVCRDRRLPLAWRTTLRFQNLLSALQTVRLGAGIMPDMPMFYCVEEFRKGLLCPALPGWHRPPLECQMLSGRRALATRRVRVFHDWLAGELRRVFSECEREAAALANG